MARANRKKKSSPLRKQRAQSNSKGTIKSKRSKSNPGKSNPGKRPHINDMGRHVGDDGYIPHDTPVPSPKRPAHGSPIVGIGASAGGLEAMEAFFRRMPASPGLAFVVVTHQVPSHASLLPEILGRNTRMSVKEAQGGQKVEPNCVYVAPPGSDVSLVRGELQLTDPPPARVPALPIDFFFRSLAEDRQDKAIGIVLSGSGSDGTCGIRAIKGESGMVMVQKPTSAKFPGMPDSAISTGLADFVLDVEEMPERLLAYVKGPYLSAPSEAGAVTSLSAEAMKRICGLVRSRTGNDFDCYKSGTVRRRVERRMAIHQFLHAQDYMRYLEQNPHEIDLLFQELLIGVTSFFRDSEAFKVLSESVPQLLRDRSGKEPIRAWVAGCSTGEEAYSLAIVLCESAERVGKRIPIQVFGTDLDKSAIENARSGFYPEGIAVDVSPERLTRFFERYDHGYRVKKELREMVVFAPQNVLTDPPFTKLDLLSCRNLLIYLDGDAQKRIVPLFHYALRPGGLLFLGSSEGVGADGLFSAVDKKWKVYSRKPGPSSAVHGEHFPTVPGRAHATEHAPGEFAAKSARRPGVTELIEKELLRKYAPASVTVNERGDIFYIHGRTGMYLEPASGQPSFNVLQMAREGLRLDLAAALRRAAAQHKEIARGPVHVKTDGEYVAVNFVVRPVTEPEPVRGLFVIAFDRPQPKRKAASSKKKRRVPPAAKRVLELEEELSRTSDRLQSSVEEVETTNEELKSANEELQSTNEELQSTNEELETAKEEMQSLNEELQTVNAELQNKIEELSKSNDDMKNLLNNTDIATIFLDNELNIKRFTDQAMKVIHLIPSDVDRPLGDIVSNLAYDRLIRDAEDVLRTLTPKETEVQTHDGAWYMVRIIPYRTTDNVIDGVVITLVEVSRLKRAEASSRRLAQIVESAADAIVGQDLAGIILTWNPAAVQVYGYAPEEIIGRPYAQVVPSDRIHEYESILACVSRGDVMTDWKTMRRRKDGRQFSANVTMFPIREETGRIVGLTSMARPIPSDKQGARADDADGAFARSEVEPLS